MRISLLIDSPLSVLMHAMRGLDSAVRREIASRTKGVAEPVWLEELRGRAATRRQSRLADSGRVGVTQQNVFLRAGLVGKLSSGTPVSAIAKATEFGVNAEKLIDTRSRKGTRYKRRIGPTFGPTRRQGNVAYPAAREVIRRIASLWIQTAYRTTHEEIEKV
ncbi:hypothetical protein SK224_00215 [Microbacterium sp. BG28]|uniref:hypothetical protein n=1 Tax=Microbacterium sp. BG28 TaxID=3097356 RepID=UPI002A5A4D9E|nr:hypothetical protein [Microbacterium sp. BG28]MDY0827543.1 hypothetical protein [Microbacterium sp. BG28]